MTDANRDHEYVVYVNEGLHQDIQWVSEEFDVEIQEILKGGIRTKIRDIASRKEDLEESP